jgi:glycosyltransferase involved in cell wall biosynthesis
MHILFLTDNFPPEVNAPASRTYEHGSRWVELGEEVTVITCAPNFPKGKVFDGYKNSLWSEELIDGIRVIRVWSYMAANEGFFKRILDYLTFMVSAFLASLLVRRVDVVVGTSPQFFTALAAWAVGFVKRVPFVFDLRDLWPESIKAVGAMRQSVLLRMLERIEMFLYRKAARIISVTYSFRQELIRRGIDGGKIDVVTNGVDMKRFSWRAKDISLQRELGFHGCFVAGYIGTHGMAHALETLLVVMKELQDHPKGRFIRLLFLGDGAQKSHLIAEAESLGLKNVVFVDTVPKNMVARYWSILDVSIIHLRRSDLFSAVIPSKLFECMGMGVPVLHGVLGESANIVQDEGCGIVFEPENSQELISRLLEIQDDRQLLDRLREASLRAARRYDRTSLSSLMLDSLRSTQFSGIKNR